MSIPLDVQNSCTNCQALKHQLEQEKINSICRKGEIAIAALIGTISGVAFGILVCAAETGIPGLFLAGSLILGAVVTAALISGIAVWIMRKHEQQSATVGQLENNVTPLKSE